MKVRLCKGSRVSRILQQLMPHEHRGPQRSAGIASRRLHPNVVERTFAKDSTVPNAVQRDSASHHEVLLARLLLNMSSGQQHDLFGNGLHRSSQIHFTLCDFCLGLAWWSAKQLVELRPSHREALAVVEVAHVHTERAVRFQVKQVIQNQLLKPRLAVRCEPHDFVLAAVHAKAGVVRECRVQQSDRMRKADLVCQFDLVSATNADARR